MTSSASNRNVTIPRRPHRLQELMRVLAERGSLHLREAATLLGVSEMTVRRDVAERSDLITYLGGHLIAADGLNGATRYARYTLSDEEKSHTAAKTAVSARAAELITDGDTLFIDCGSTTPHLATRIPRGVRATVICYALNVAEILCRNSDLRVIMLGGLWHPSSASFSSDENLALIAKLGINKAFISAAGVDATRGVSCVQFHEVAVKQAAMARSVEKYLMIDSSKFGQVKPAFFARNEDFDRIITDDGIAPEFAKDKALRSRLLIAPK
jgi:DeoR family transcriptional regulator, deoxyribose operon repressor